MDYAFDKRPRVSVLMPVHNAGRFLTEAIESVLAQTFEDFEFLVLDDGSTDDSGAIVARYAREDPRIRHVTRSNSGISRSLNELAGLARGAYLARMDADDVCLPDRFRLQVERLDADPQIAALGGLWISMSEAGDPIFQPRPPTDHDAIDAANLRGIVALNHPTVMMRKARFDAVGGYDEQFAAAQDLDLWLRLAEIGTLANLDVAVLHYRYVEAGISGSCRDAQSQAVRRACEAAWARRGLPPATVDFEATRPGRDRRSRTRFALQCGWQAWNSDNHATARRFFRQALVLRPHSLDAWRAVLFAARQRD